MGEINVASKGDRKNPSRKKLSTRVDLTPMVDLGFLLITFFIFTTSMNEPKSMKLNLPSDQDSSKTAEGKTLNVLLGKNDKLWYYYGKASDQMSSTNYSIGVRELIRQKREYVKATYGKDELVVLIKPTTFSSYKNVVDILDEMVINGVTRYVLMEPAPGELTLLNGH